MAIEWWKYKQCINPGNNIFPSTLKFLSENFTLKGDCNFINLWLFAVVGRPKKLCSVIYWLSQCQKYNHLNNSPEKV